MQIFSLLIDLVKTAGVVVFFAYVVTRTSFFLDILDKKLNWKNQLVMIVLFGALSIFGTYGGLQLPSGAIANIRDLGPMPPLPPSRLARAVRRLPGSSWNFGDDPRQLTVTR